MNRVPVDCKWGLFLLLGACYLVPVQGGLCWQYRAKNGTCYGLVSSNISEKKCCSSGRGVAFSSKEIGGNEFRYVFVLKPTCFPCEVSCDNIRCGPNKKCKITDSGIAECQCDPDCTSSYKGQVCGSDGKTYSSECALLKKKCMARNNLIMDYHGPCKAMCMGVKCLNGKVCLTGRDGHSYCVPQKCPRKCHARKQKQVCGTDNHSYSSVCHLLHNGCRLRRKISVAYVGPCRPDAECDNVACPRHTKCVTDSSGQPRCIRCECKVRSHSLPVCGNDGVRYASWCDMRRHGCDIKRLLTIDLSGKC